MTTFQTILCDRCGRNFAKDREAAHSWEEMRFRWHGNYDICSGCLVSFQKWMDAIKRGDNVVRVQFK